MIVVLSSIEDIAGGGSVEIDADHRSTLKFATSRIQRTALLNGGVSLIHKGFTHGDRTLTIRARITAADEAVLWAINNAGEKCYLSTGEGFFLGAISSLNTGNLDLTLVFQVEEKIN